MGLSIIVLVLIHPQQNGIAERKNKHLLEVARALLFSTKVPKYLWGEAVLTAAYLINRMTSKALQFQTPLHVFKEYFLWHAFQLIYH